MNNFKLRCILFSTFYFRMNLRLAYLVPSFKSTFFESTELDAVRLKHHYWMLIHHISNDLIFMVCFLH